MSIHPPTTNPLYAAATNLCQVHSSTLLSTLAMRLDQPYTPTGADSPSDRDTLEMLEESIRDTRARCTFPGYDVDVYDPYQRQSCDGVAAAVAAVKAREAEAARASLAGS